MTLNSIGVADGVSGWNNYGVSSKDFSNELMQNCKDLIEKSASLKKCVEDAFYKVKSGGSAAWILAKLDKFRLKIANLGDCGLMIIRYIHGNPKIIFQSETQEHSFNTPYQLSRSLSKSQLEILKEKLNSDRFAEVTEQMKHVV